VGSFYRWSVEEAPLDVYEWVGINTREYQLASEGPDDLNLLPEQIILTPELLQASELAWAIKPDPSSVWEVEEEPDFYWRVEIEPDFYWAAEIEPDFYYGLQEEPLFYWLISVEPLFYYTDQVAPVDQGEWGEFYLAPARFYIITESVTSFYFVITNFDC